MTEKHVDVVVGEVTEEQQEMLYHKRTRGWSSL
mgnify:CR=1 FL=1